MVRATLSRRGAEKPGRVHPWDCWEYMSYYTKNDFSYLNRHVVVYHRHKCHDFSYFDNAVVVRCRDKWVHHG